MLSGSKARSSSGTPVFGVTRLNPPGPIALGDRQVDQIVRRQIVGGVEAVDLTVVVGAAEAEFLRAAAWCARCRSRRATSGPKN